MQTCKQPWKAAALQRIRFLTDSRSLGAVSSQRLCNMRVLGSRREVGGLADVAMLASVVHAVGTGTVHAYAMKTRPRVMQWCYNSNQ
jgi:hypothetical protein